MSVYCETVDGKLMPIIKNNICTVLPIMTIGGGAKVASLPLPSCPYLGPYHVIFFTKTIFIRMLKLNHHPDPKAPKKKKKRWGFDYD